MRLLSVLLGLLLYSSSALAQFSESIEVSIANVDVVVLDRHGNPVHGLTRDDFQIYEDGKLQQITNFTAYESSGEAKPAGSSAAAPAPGVPPRDRLIAIVIDIDDIDPMPRERFFTGLREFVKRSARGGDEMVLLAWSNRLHVAVPTTTSSAEIDAALVRFQKMRHWSEHEILNEIAEDRIRAAADVAANPGPGGMTIDVEAERQFEEWLIAEQRCSRIKRKITAFSELIASIAALDRQKILILASDDLSLQPERTCLLADDMEKLAASANAHGVRIDAFHPPGERIKPTSPEFGNYLPGLADPPRQSGQSARTFDESWGLLMLADRTGGRAAVGPAPAVQAMTRTAEELDNYYSLAYRLGPGKFDQAREIRVVTKNRAYTVRARKSVAALSDESKLRDSVITSLYSAKPREGRFPVSIEVKSATREGKLIRLQLSVKFPLRSLTLLPAGDGQVKGAFSVYAAAGQELGDASGVSRQQQSFTRPAASVQPGGQESIEYAFEMVARSYTRRIAIAVRDEIGKDYSVATIDVPGVPKGR